MCHNHRVANGRVEDSPSFHAQILNRRVRHWLSTSKQILKILFTIVFAHCVFAQTITTNWATTAPNIRQVGGKFYNVDRSVLFSDFDGKIQQVVNGGIIIHEYETQPIYQTESYGGVTTGNFLSGGTRQIKIGENVLKDRNIFISNYPVNLMNASSERLRGRAMRMGVTNISGETIAFYDYGKRGINPIYKTNSLEAVATNVAIPKAASELPNNQRD